MQNLKYMCGGCTTVRRRKAAGWLAFPNPEKKGFEGFAGFVTIND